MSEEENVGTPDETPEELKTDVDGVNADDVVKQGTERFPVFDVGFGEFHQNMEMGRRRLRFKTGSKAQQYMQGTKYRRAFYVRHTDDKGKKYIRRVK